MSVLDDFCIRMSTVEDLPDIMDLIKERLGNKEYLDFYNDLDNRYLLCYDGNHLIAMTGINFSSKYKGLEVDWTLVRDVYEDSGIITEMLSLLLKEESDNTVVFAEVYRYADNTLCVLQHAMDKLGFRLCLPKRVVFDSRYHTCSKDCSRRIEGVHCSCSIDLYIKGDVV